MKKKNLDEIKVKAGLALSRFKPQTFVSKKDKMKNRSYIKQKLKRGDYELPLIFFYITL